MLVLEGEEHQFEDTLLGTSLADCGIVNVGVSKSDLCVKIGLIEERKHLRVVKDLLLTDLDLGHLDALKLAGNLGEEGPQRALLGQWALETGVADGVVEVEAVVNDEVADDVLALGGGGVAALICIAEEVADALNESGALHIKFGCRLEYKFA